MAGPNAPHDEEEPPLDPAAERVRRKLVRFMGINLGILFAAVMAVVAALVYRSASIEGGSAAQQTAVPVSPDDPLSGDIVLPAGARVLSHAASQTRLTLHLQFPDGSEAIHLYDMHEARPVGRFRVLRAVP